MMIKIKHLILITIIFIICIFTIVSFIHYNENIDKKDNNTTYRENLNQNSSYNVSLANNSYNKLENSLNTIKIEKEFLVKKILFQIQ